MMLERHRKELNDSKISETIIALNFVSLQGNSCYSHLLYSLGVEERRNDGRLRDKWIKNYSHLDDGGWWCGAGIDLTTLNSNSLANQCYGVESEWGCFKPNTPRMIHGKPIKYEHPPHAQTELFSLKIAEEDWIKIANKLDKHEEVCEVLKQDCPTGGYIPEVQFWQWVIDNPLPVIITEGAKKAASVLSTGYICIALPGITTGWRSETGQLIDPLKALCRAGREFCIAFDQDAKFITKIDVFRAAKRLGELLETEGVNVSVLLWEPEEGKGIDDLIAKAGEGRLDEVFEERILLGEYCDRQQIHRISAAKLLEFIQRNFGKKLAFNELTQRVELNGKPLELGNELRYWLIEEYLIDAAPNHLIDALLYVAKKNSYHPVEKYLKACYAANQFLPIDNLSQRYLGTSNPIYDVFVKKWLIGAVARVLEPGCQMDHALILKSDKQGTGKTNFFRKLAGEWFDGSFGSNLESRQSLMVLHRCWIQEWGEFERIVTKREAGEIKDFMTKLSDCFVKPYGRDALDYPRRFVFCGSTNEDDFLRDKTGSRRFLVIPIQSNWMIPFKTLEAERSLLWASAVKEYLEGKKQGVDAWVLTPEEYEQLEKSNQAFRDYDEWEGLIANWAETNHKEKITITEVLRECFDVENNASDHKRQQMRVSKALKQLGWKKLKPVNGANGDKQHYWLKPETPTVTEAEITTPKQEPSPEKATEPQNTNTENEIASNEKEWTYDVWILRPNDYIELKSDRGKYWRVEFRGPFYARIVFSNTVKNIDFKTEFRVVSKPPQTHPQRNGKKP
ncbi:VapE domain-containing protein [Gloeothece verrucosa]|uniref:Virulence-associated E family protein n=1 Tax=Gloeothece verrucosa (strain PCC 7822) TaxID=497965 RepID=E0U6Z0_GLOV7|nr:VapE domain-containing protein [Gloeothece verrucosa]ADN16027.1 virulence-associated E family protein [Gloeothece verrucosa PCC 7822]